MMRAIAFLLCALLATPSVEAARVRGHVTKKGSYAQPHQRTNPDRSRANNYSSKPNVNPYTGKAGTRDSYAPKAPRRR